MNERHPILETISRRAFLASGTAGLIVGPLLSTLPAEPIPSERPAPGPPVLKPAPLQRFSEIPAELLRHVHPDVRFNRVELPAEQNALPLLQVASKRFRDSESFLAEPPYNVNFAPGSTLQKEFDAFENGGPLPRGETAAAIRRWMEVNQPACALMDEAIARNGMQLPKDFLLNYLDDMSSGINLTQPLRSLATFRVIRARFRLESHDFGRAGDDIAQVLKLGRILAEADVFLVDRLMAASIQSRALKVICQWAVMDKLADDACAQWIRELPNYAPSAGSVGQTERVEFCLSFLPELQRLPVEPLSELMDTLMVRHMCVIQQAETRRLFGVDDDDVRQVRHGLNVILRGHPRPLDKVETVQLASALSAEMLRDLNTPYHKRRRDIVSSLGNDIKAWPGYLRPTDSPANFFFGNKALTPPPAKELEATRQALRQVSNPVGKLMAVETTGFDILRRLTADWQAQFAATRIVLAFRRQLNRNGTMPNALNDLIRAGVIDDVPLDPFSGQPFRYSRERGLLWSVGSDEIDNNGDWDFEAQIPTGKDLVWRLPQAKMPR